VSEKRKSGPMPKREKKDWANYSERVKKGRPPSNMEQRAIFRRRGNDRSCTEGKKKEIKLNSFIRAKVDVSRR